MRSRLEGASLTGSARSEDHQGISASNAVEPAKAATCFRNSRRRVRWETMEGESGVMSFYGWEHRTSNIEHRTSNIEHRTSNAEEVTPCALRLLTPALSSFGEERETESVGVI
jgi:hypothetical protein